VVTLKVQRANEEPQEIKITRGEISIDSVTWEDKGDGIAYIRVSRFGGDTNTQWDKVVSQVNVKMKELDAVIVDVRGNPGGYLQSAVHLAGEFYDNKPVIYEENAEGEKTPLKTDRVGVFNKVPAVYVLIDGGSASASEILAAALRDTIGAKLVGVKSFGKGTIQDAENFEDGSGVHITIAKWLTPNKEWVHKKGLMPDFEVDRTSEDFKNNKDPQLDKAISLAKEI
jgi:carboxyl-terminal processing protease